jgi:hypothetical protein
MPLSSAKPVACGHDLLDTRYVPSLTIIITISLACAGSGSSHHLIIFALAQRRRSDGYRQRVQEARQVT